MEKILSLNVNICSGCGACAVACFDHNDIDLDKQPALRRIVKVESGKYPNVSIAYVSAGCMHCHDSPCLIGCPTGAIWRNEKTGAILVDQDVCMGCHSCAMACPFGVPRYDNSGKMHKCELCAGWIDAGQEPACARACPTGALEFKAGSHSAEAKQDAFIGRVVSAAKEITASIERDL